MTIQEAIDNLKCMRLYMQITDEKSESKFSEDDYIANDMAIKALEKQVPTKPIHVTYRLKTGTLHHMAYCGNCGKYNQRVYIRDKYCRKCGCKIDWRDENGGNI